ncbi:zinc finger protein [Trichonephila clavipes]|nr:zinc finger protein [Trichonephila clavipes]
MELSQQTELQDQVVVPEVIKKPRIPPFFVSPKGDWRQLVVLAKLIAPYFQKPPPFSKGHCGRRSRLQEPQSLARTIRDAPKIFDFTELFGTRIEVKPFDRGNKINQCWRCQGWFHSSEVCHLPPRCVRCAGPHLAKDCTLDFDAPMKCANCSGEHAANWSRCPKHPRSMLAPLLLCPPTPAPSKDASINAGLLIVIIDLFVIIEDTPCIDKQVFCRAFKNSLSALRSASADVDKTYIIFEAYCKLRHSQA